MDFKAVVSQMKYFIMLLMGALAFPALGQSFEWAFALPTNEISEITMVKSMPGGGACVVGVFRGTLDLDPGPGTHVYTTNFPFGLPATDSFIAVYGPAGEFLWGRRYNMHVSIYDLDVLPTGDIIFCGRHTQSFSPDIGGGMPTTSSTGGFVIRLNAQGEFVNIHDLPSHQVNRVVAHPTDGYYIAGSFLNELEITVAGTPLTYASSGSSDVFVALIQQEEYVWAGSVGGLGYDKVADLDVNQDGVMLATRAGAFGMDADPGPTTAAVAFSGYNRLVLSMLDLPGGFVDAIVFDLEVSEYSVRTRFVEGGGILVAVTANGTVNISPTQDPLLITTNAVDGILLRLDGTHDLIWVNHLTGQWGNGIDNMAVHPAGHEVIITGRFLGDVDLDPGIGEDTHFNFNSGSSFYMAAYCMDDGALKWSFPSTGNSGSSSGKGIAFAEDTSFFVGGSGNAGMDLDPGTGVADPNYPLYSGNAFLAKYNAGPPQPCPETTITSIDMVSMTDMIVAYPNPAMSEVALWVPPNIVAQNLRLYLTDLNGRDIQAVLIVQEKTLVDLTDLSPGMYLMSVKAEGKLLRTFKVHKL